MIIDKQKAIKVRQSGFRLFSTSLKVGDLLSEGFYSIEPLNPIDPETGNYQRELIPKRAEEIARDVLRAMKNGDFFMPSTILLATANRLDYDEASGTISFDTGKKKNEDDKERIGPFSIVDGQHRLGSMRKAIQLLKENPCNTHYARCGLLNLAKQHPIANHSPVTSPAGFTTEPNFTERLLEVTATGFKGKLSIKPKTFQP